MVEDHREYACPKRWLAGRLSVDRPQDSAQRFQSRLRCVTCCHPRIEPALGLVVAATPRARLRSIGQVGEGTHHPIAVDVGETEGP